MSLERLDNLLIKNGGVPDCKPLLCLEVNPPRGVDVESVCERLQGNLAGVDFLNITDSALARMRMSALPFASIIKQRFKIETMVNLSCRDRNVIALQSDILAGCALGVRSIVALTGDAVSVGDNPEAKGVFEINSIGLLNLINQLNSGKDLVGNELKGATSIIPGVVLNPNVKNPNAEIRRLEKKKAAGALYALSQPVFDEQASSEFFKAASKVGVPIFVGLLPFSKASAALSVEKHVPGIKIPQSIVDMANKFPDQDLSQFFIEHCLKLAEINRPYVCGFHVISGSTPKLALKLVGKLAEYIKQL